MRILVTVGTCLQPFDRLLQYTDEAISALHEPVTGICQYGPSQVRPRHLTCRETISRKDFEAEIAASDVLISHAGIGTLSSAIREGHKALVVARRGALGEHVNDHQLEIVEELRRAGSIEVIETAAQMRQALLQYERGERRRGPRLADNPARLAKVVEAIEEGPVRHALPIMGKMVLRVLAALGPPIDELRVR